MPRSGVLGHATRIDPAPAEHDALGELASHADASAELVLRTSDGAEHLVPHSLLRLLIAAAEDLAAGPAVMAIPAEVELIPAEAAELLGLSRPFVARLLDQGDIASEFLPDSRHRRVKLSDVLAFQARRERRAEGRRRIADTVTSADLRTDAVGICVDSHLRRHERVVPVLCHGPDARCVRGAASTV